MCYLQEDAVNTGRAFCFLPLPVKTGLTVQINGYFEVSSNRRGIWYGADMDRSGRIRSIICSRCLAMFALDFLFDARDGKIIFQARFRRSMKVIFMALMRKFSASWLVEPEDRLYSPSLAIGRLKLQRMLWLSTTN